MAGIFTWGSKMTILFIPGLAVCSCNDTSHAPENNNSDTPEHHASEGESVKNPFTKEEALEKAKAVLLKHNKEIEEKLKVVDCGDYYTVTPDLPPCTIGGGWSVDLDSSSGEVLKIYFTE